jgi:hypothetical protein
MSGDAAFARRVARLAITSAIALGLLAFLCSRTLNVHRAVTGCLVAGWILMPTILAASLRWPRVRYAIFVPAVLITAGLVAICATALPDDWIARVGWILTTAGIMLGGVLGMWFWYRWAPVPARLDDPFSRGRWSLIGVHVALVLAGLAIIGLSL